jgi:PilZ domain
MNAASGWSFSPSPACNVRRREPRYISSVPVALQRFLLFGTSLTRGVSLDISVLGMSALVCGPPGVGETIVISLSLGDTPVEMLATVRHSSLVKSGFEFYSLSATAMRALEHWVQELRKYEKKLCPWAHGPMLTVDDR